MDKEEKIPSVTIDTFARSIFKQAKDYGFMQIDYVRLVNKILDCATNPDNSINDRPYKKNDIQKRINADNLPVSGERITIRKFDKRLDLKDLKIWLDDKSGRYFLMSHATSRILTVDELLKNNNNVLGTIIFKENSRVIGMMAFLNKDDFQKKAELRKLIGVPEMRGKGLGKEATSLWIEYGKQGLKLNKIYLNTLDTNIRNIKLNEELGFKVEGILRNEILVDNSYRDVLRMGLWQD
ncbi:GNAT family N-acetyltransferase [bacterium]|nr:GNAT family N-acetyltransferase [bacterium]